MANEIPIRQNDPELLRLLLVSWRLYGQAKLAMVVQVTLVVIVPLGLIVLEQLRPGSEAAIAALSVGIAILDVLLLDRLRNALQRRAASVQELFDSRLFCLAWPELRAKRPDNEDIEYLSRGAIPDRLRNWYSPAILPLAPAVAVVLCQRSNCRWDSQLRRYFRTSLLLMASALLVGVAVVGVVRDVTFADLVLSLLVPVTPVALWGIREAYRQDEAADRAERLKDFGDDLWRQLISKAGPAPGRAMDSRAFQDAILEHRQRSPMVFDWFYLLLRGSFEKQMHFSVEQMAQEAIDAGLT